MAEINLPDAVMGCRTGAVLGESIACSLIGSFAFPTHLPIRDAIELRYGQYDATVSA